MPPNSRGRKSSSRKKRLVSNLKKILPVVIILAYLYYLLFGPYGFINIIKLKTKEIHLRKRKTELIEKRNALSDSIKMIKKDTLLLEKIAREKLGMIKPGDTVIFIQK